MDKVEMRSVIKYLHLKGKSPLEIFQEMKNTYRDNGPTVFVVQYWVRKFKFGFPGVRDEVRSGRPVEAITEKNVSKVKGLVLEDRRITIKELIFQTKLSRGTIGRILHDHLNMSKVCARWIPRLLTDEMKAERKRCSAMLLEHFQSTPNFLIALSLSTRHGSICTTPR